MTQTASALKDGPGLGSNTNRVQELVFGVRGGSRSYLSSQPSKSIIIYLNDHASGASSRKFIVFTCF